MASLFGPSPHSRFFLSSRETTSVFYPQGCPAGSPVALPPLRGSSLSWRALPEAGTQLLPASWQGGLSQPPLYPSWTPSPSLVLPPLPQPTLCFCSTYHPTKEEMYLFIMFAVSLYLTCCLDAQSCPILLRPHGL